jgi:hypothetical protein
VRYTGGSYRSSIPITAQGSATDDDRAADVLALLLGESA